MKKMICLPAVLVLLLFFYGLCGAEAPRQIATFRLGTDISQYKDLVQMDTAVVLRHSEYLSETDIKPIEGYKSGYLAYGNCDQPGAVIKIKMKYERDDKEFFDELMERFDKKFGKPAEYKGDAFRACIAWKWAFTDAEKNKIYMVLQHNCQDDEDYTSGNAVKLWMKNRIDSERTCYDNKHPEPKGEDAEKKAKKKPDFKNLIPE
jgi:hypothetical protein